jgi:hypothetical protein
VKTLGKDVISSCQPRHRGAMSEAVPIFARGSIQSIPVDFFTAEKELSAARLLQCEIFRRRKLNALPTE